MNKIVPTPPIRDLFWAICQKESGGDCAAVNYKEGAIGPAQIRLGYLIDANEQLRKEKHMTYAHGEMHNPEKARIVFNAYMRRYGAKTDEDRARAHNGGGPHGRTIKETEQYWNDVQAILRKGQSL